MKNLIVYILDLFIVIFENYNQSFKKGHNY
jgi:hypothetical protein